MFYSDDGNFFHAGRKDIIVNNNVGVRVAAADVDDGSVVQKYQSLSFGSSNSERIAIEEPIETAYTTESHSSMSHIIKQVVKPNFYEKIRNIPPLNLKLENWQSLAVDVETLLSKQSSTQGMTQMNQDSGCYNHGMMMMRRRKPQRASFVSQQMSEKMKASNFPALLLKIGSWGRVTRHEEDLVGKCYYAKKKLVWEFLEMSLKRKIEIQWADIVGIRATIEENEPGILELELKQPPTFHHETDPQPRKHTNWGATQDFTERQALIWRRHYLEFPPGVLDRHLEKLFQCDNRLFELSQKPFPTLGSPFFQPTSIYGISETPLNFFGQIPQIYQGLHLSHPHLSPFLFSAQQVQPCQPTWQMPPSLCLKDSSFPAEDVGNDYYVDNPGMAFWGHGANQVQGNFTVASTTPPVVSYQDNNDVKTGNMSVDLLDHMILEAVKSNLMADIEFIDEKCCIPMMASYEALINQANHGGQDIYAGRDMEFSAKNHANDATGHVYPEQPVAWMLPQDSENRWLPAQPTQQMPMNQHNNSLMYQMRDDFVTFNNHGVNKNP